jgi:uncharacterized protein YbgA (DUF1722 family)/uncharacterized protein YbbK (DUF523 family)
MPSPLTIGVSACLLGQEVRYDGGHKHDRYLTDTLGRFCRFVPVCPEVECGLPTPREAMRLEGDPAAPRLMTRQTRQDLTDRMLAYCADKVEELATTGLSGFIFKKDSPSSGLYRVKVYRDGQAVKSGSGLFAAAMARRFPLLPLEEEGRLHDPAIREHFIERVFTRHRWLEFRATVASPGDLVAFHTRHKLLLMAHSPQAYRETGRLVAAVTGGGLTDQLERYEQLLMAGMAKPATTGRQVNVLLHIMGYFKKQLTTDEKIELLEIIESYRSGLLPLIVPLTLLKHHVRRFRQPYLLGQLYLDPHPAELMLRNHA